MQLTQVGKNPRKNRGSGLMLPRAVAFFRPTNQEVVCSNHTGRTIRLTFRLPNGKSKVRSWQALSGRMP